MRSRCLSDAVPAKKPRAPRASKMPLIVVAQSEDKAAAEAGLERWRAAHPEAAALLAVDDVLVDRMRGASTIWYRIRVNLRHVPEEQRPAQGTPDPDDDPTRAWTRQFAVKYVHGISGEDVRCLRRRVRIAARSSRLCEPVPGMQCAERGDVEREEDGG